jgi:hypothetical protein
VIDAWSAVRAVSGSRTSPTRIASGSCRSTLRSSAANVLPCASLTGICVTPSSWISTGSSIVTTFRSLTSMSRITAYSVLVLPDPVGPHTRNIPESCRIAAMISSYIHCGSCRSHTWYGVLAVSRIRSTSFCPNMAGAKLTR